MRPIPSKLLVLEKTKTHEVWYNMSMTPKERNKKWKALRTPEERKAYSQARHERNRKTERLAGYHWNRTVKHRFSVLKNAAKRRKLECSLSFSNYAVLVSHPCFYCGGILSETGGGLDRVNNNVGYVQGNVRPCCHPCNQAKSDFTESQFREWILRVYNTYVVGVR
jgi:hypothetical protein